MGLKIVFSGVVAVAEHATGVDKVRVILPNTYPHDVQRRALDDEVLRAHLPHFVVKLDGGDLQPPPRLLQPGYSLHLGGLPSNGTALRKDLSKMLRMGCALDSKWLRMDRRVIEPISGDLVTTYVDIARDELTTRRHSEWRIDGRPLDGPDGTYDLASDVVWIVDVQGKDTTLETVPFGGGPGSVLAKLPTASKDVELRIQNFVPADLWGQFGPSTGQHGPVDDDFRWYYQCLDGDESNNDDQRPRGWVKKKVKGASLPVPAKAHGPSPHSGTKMGDGPSGRSDTLGWTHNCMPTLYTDETW